MRRILPLLLSTLQWQSDRSRRNDAGRNVHRCFSFHSGRAAGHVWIALFMSWQSRPASLVSENWSFTSPTDASAIQAVTPSDVYSWAGPDVSLTQSSERTGIENKWFALTGRVVALKVEADGDLHIALTDATGDKPGIVIVEVPAKPQWCEIRKTFSVGHVRDSLFTLALPRSWRSIKLPLSLLLGKRTSMLLILLKTKNQTGEAIFPTTLHGKFIPWWN